MRMRDGLPRSGADVDADVVTSRRELSLESLLHLRNRSPYPALLFRREIEVARDVPARDDERVAGAHRISIGERRADIGLQEEVRGGRDADAEQAAR